MIDLCNLTMEDVSKLVGITKPCGYCADPSYATNTVYLEGDEKKVCDACREVDYRQCVTCRKWHHRTEVTSNIYGFICDDCDYRYAGRL